MRPDSTDDGPRPPKILAAIIRASLPEDDESLARELETLWVKRVRETGRAAADRWLARQALGFAFRVGASRLTSAHTIGSLFSDARVSVRSMRRTPAFALSFVLTLAVAAGVLAAVYDAANWVLLRPVPGVRGAEQLATMRIGGAMTPPRVSWDVSQPDLLTLRERLAPLAELAEMTPVDVDLRTNLDAPRRVAAEFVSANYFSLLRTRMYAGRSFLAREDSAGAPGVVVLSFAFARSLSPEPAALLDTDVRANGTLLRVVGVAEPGFRGAELPGRPLLWLSSGALSVIDPSAKAGAFSERSYVVWRRMICRLTGVVSSEQLAVAANGVMNGVRVQFRRHSFVSNIKRLQVFPGVGLDPGVRASVRRTLGLLFGAAAFLLCLAVANLTNLALTRTLSTGEATAVRFALGATRGRIARGMFVETLILGGVGGVLALAVTAAWSRWFEGSQLSEVGGSLEGMRVDLRVASFAMLVSMAAAVAAFLRPALMTRRRPLEQLMRRTATGLRGHALRSTLVGLQVALSVVLLVAALLLGRTVVNLRRIDLGFSPERLMTIAADPQLHGYDLARAEQMALDVERRLNDEPGIAGAGVVSPIPLRSSYMTAALDPEDDVDRKRQVVGAGYYVTPGFLHALGVQFLAGDSSWRADSGTVVITREMLKQLFPGVSPANAVGLSVRARKTPVRIAAVVSDVKLSDLTSDAPPTVFRPLRAGLVGEPMVVYVRTTNSGVQATPVVTRVMASVAPEVPLFDAHTARESVDLQFAERRVMAIVASMLGLLGIVLAAIGLYGVLANVVAAGQREIAIRSALGATPSTILTHVLARGTIPVVVGAVVGVGGAAAMSRLLKSQLYGLGALDPGTYGWSVALMAGIALVACLPPALRATRVSIVQMLRAD